MSSSYKRLSKLGSGAFATTFLVEEQGKGPESKGGGKRLVMKRVPCRHMRAANAALQEVKVLLSCHHDGIVGYHDFFLDSDSDENIVICLVMEFCDEGDLWERIAAARRAHTPLPPSLVAGWTLQLVSALRYLHARSILHRDIKPENVFLTSGGAVAKLGDFGLATPTEGLDASSQKSQVGTPDYMAPEVLEGRPYSEPADVFSLGATMCAAPPHRATAPLHPRRVPAASPPSPPPPRHRRAPAQHHRASLTFTPRASSSKPQSFAYDTTRTSLQPPCSHRIDMPGAAACPRCFLPQVRDGVLSLPEDTCAPSWTEQTP
jgi:serine/threonine protein kinase